MSYTISVAMALYNGERYLQEQLESIYKQSLQPNELIVCDDGSTDNSDSLFEEFVTQNGLGRNWKLFKNENNLGLIKNFLHCASLCNCDVVFFSDQDDIWDNCKIEKMIKVFENNPDAEAVVCAYQAVNADLREEKSLVERIKRKNSSVTKKSKVPLTTQTKTMLSGGLTLAVKRTVLAEITPYILANELTYDIPIGLICAARGTLYRIDEPLVLHRVHLSNSGSPELNVMNRLKNIERHIAGREFELKHLICFLDAPGVDLHEFEVHEIKREILARKSAIECMKHRKIGGLLKLLFRKNAYDNKMMDVANLACTLYNLF